jgi:hypothetical protein
MSIDYGKTAPEKRFFLLFGEEGAWQEVSMNTYLSAQIANGIKGITPMDHFEVENLQGTVTEDGSRPKDVKKPVVAEPMVRRTSVEPDASYRLIFPTGSYGNASIDDDTGTATIILSPTQYEALSKAQGPVLLDRWAQRLDGQTKDAGPVKEALIGGLADTLRSVATDMRDGKPTKPKRPTIQDLKDLLKG